jgi:hypothetical protein
MTQIPPISEGLLEQLAKTIKPVVRYARKGLSSKLMRDDEGELYYIKPVDPVSETFLWSPTRTGLARDVNPRPYKTIETLHTYGAPAYFKPSVAEVLAQIPTTEVMRCVAFETRAAGFSKDSGYHRAYTKLYEKLS